jgi:ABC-type lipoprotein release transport system permease subunit
MPLTTLPLPILLKRAWHYRVMLSVLLFTVCLATGFFSLSPMYVRVLAESALRYTLRTRTPESYAVIVTNPQPFAPEEVLNTYLDETIIGHDRSMYTEGIQCGYPYASGETISLTTTRTDNPYYGCQKIFSYSDQDKFFRLVQGRMPELTDVPLSSEPTIGEPQVEGLVTVTAAQRGKIEIGKRVVIGGSPTRTAVIEIVGIVEPLLPETHPYYANKQVLIRGQIIDIGNLTRFDFGVLVREEAMNTRIIPVAQTDMVYEDMAGVRFDTIRADRIDTLADELQQSELGLRREYPDVVFRTRLQDLIAEYRAGVAQTEPPILLMASALLVFILFQLATTVTMLLDQQRQEFAGMMNRGASATQLMRIQWATVAGLGVLGAILGPMIALGIMLVLRNIGPLATILQDAQGISIPTSTFALSCAAAVMSVTVLTIPAWRTARAGLRQFAPARPTTPVWLRYGIDVLLIALGVILLIRLYTLVSPDSSLEPIFRDPALLLRLIASEDNALFSLSDPFNLAVPLLMLTGAALFWLRLFPLLLHAGGVLIRTSNRLSAPLAMWNLQRDLGYYATLVLLMIGAMALGTASLILAETQDRGAWITAQEQVGGMLRLDVVEPIDANSLPGVTAAIPIMRVDTADDGRGTFTSSFIGLEPDSVAVSFPDILSAVAPLREREPQPLPGLELPEDIVTLQVYMLAINPSTEIQLYGIMMNDEYGEIVVPIHTNDPAGGFRLYTLPIQPDMRRFIGFEWRGETNGETRFEQELFLDDIQLVRRSGTIDVIQDFEQVTRPEWVLINNARSNPPVPTLAEAARGSGSYRLQLVLNDTRSILPAPQLRFRPVDRTIIPVVVSTSFADDFGRSNMALRRPLQVGDSVTIDVPLPLRRMDLNIRVVGIVSGFRTMTSSERFVISPLDVLQLVLNERQTVPDYYRVNQVWLNAAEGTAPTEVINAAAALSGVQNVTGAWDNYNALRRSPLPNSISGVLFVGFWITLLLSFLDFGFHLVTTTRRRAVSFAVLRSMGWRARHVWSVLAFEQTALMLPALVVGIGLGILLAGLLLPFLSLAGALWLSTATLFGLVVAVLTGYMLLLSVIAVLLRRMRITQTLRTATG